MVVCGRFAVDLRHIHQSVFVTVTVTERVMGFFSVCVCDVYCVVAVSVFCVFAVCVCEFTVWTQYVCCVYVLCVCGVCV